MWSGAPQWASWALHPNHYQNMNHEEVDWAVLAKQWIQMKETQDTIPLPPLPQPSTSQHQQPHPPVDPIPPQQIPHPPLPPPPPPPTTLPHKDDVISHVDIPTLGNVADTGTAGEMDMEIEDDRETPSNGDRQQMQNGEMWQSWDADSSAAATSGWTDAATTQDPTWSWGWQGGPNTGDVPPTSDQTTIENKDGGSYSWGVCPPGIMQRVMDYGHRDVRKERKNRNNYSNEAVAEEEKEPDFQLDAAQRKRLPGWIREGLEKMEREKQRKLEKERLMNDKEEMLRRKKEAEAQARKILEEDLLVDGQPRIPRKSKFESDSDGSDPTPSPPPPPLPTEGAKGGSILMRRKSRFEISGGGEPPEGVDQAATTPVKVKAPRDEGPTQPPILSEEERMAEMMTKLRRWMTEILLEVTNRMMREVATEVVNKARIKAPALQAKKSSALAALSGGLGLSIYSDSESEDEYPNQPREPPREQRDTYNTSESDDEQPNQHYEPPREDELDSDEELRRTIQRRRREFEVIERGILQKLQKDEEEVLKAGKTPPTSVKGEESESEEAEPSVSDKETSPALRASSVDSIPGDKNLDLKDSQNSNSSTPDGDEVSDSKGIKKSLAEESPEGSNHSDEIPKKHRKKRKKHRFSHSRSRSRDSRDKKSKKKKRKRRGSRSRSSSVSVELIDDKKSFDRSRGNLSRDRKLLRDESSNGDRNKSRERKTSGGRNKKRRRSRSGRSSSRRRSDTGGRRRRRTGGRRDRSRSRDRKWRRRSDSDSSRDRKRRRKGEAEDSDDSFNFTSSSRHRSSRSRSKDSVLSRSRTKYRRSRSRSVASVKYSRRRKSSRSRSSSFGRRSKRTFGRRRSRS